MTDERTPRLHEVTSLKELTAVFDAGDYAVGDLVEVKCADCRETLLTVKVVEGPWEIDGAAIEAHRCGAAPSPAASAEEAGAGERVASRDDPAPAGEQP